MTSDKQKIIAQLKAETEELRAPLQSERSHAGRSVDGRHGPAERTLLESMATMKAILDQAPILISTKDLDGVVTSVNARFAILANPTAAEFVGRSVFDLFPSEVAEELWKNDLAAQKGPIEIDETVTHRDGTMHTYRTTKFPLRDPGGKVFGTGAISTERGASDETYSNLLNSLNAGVVVHAPDSSILIANPAASRILELSEEQMLGTQAIDPEWKFLLEDGSDMLIDDYPVNQVLSTRESLRSQVVGINRPKMGDIGWVLVSGFPVFQNSGQIEQVVITFVDITDRKEAEVEKEKLEAELRQAQKMEAVGRLAGGVAHDFNNMLGVILGYADLILEQMDPSNPFYAYVTEIRKAGESSANLTKQLLAFARKQTVAPKVLDLNTVVANMITILQRLIGEDIDLTWVPDENLWPVNMDSSQIDQILANLCVNARDAIADVGKVIIETGNATFDEADCADHRYVVPGEYVMLAVSDNGGGMDPDMLDTIFEPFFTTKGLGKDKGTGLGLATVYGAVKQNQGFINVYSEQGQGTTFRIYLPRHVTEPGQLSDKVPDKPAVRGDETILLVEDEPAILSMATTMLEREGYTVLAAATPGEAIELAHTYNGEIHLLITDVIMPEMNGRDLAKNVLSYFPNIECLFMSGYTADIIGHHGVLNEGVNFIQKPFSKGDLAGKVRETIDRDQGK